METTNLFSEESTADFAMFQDEQSDINMQNLNVPGPDDEDTDEDEHKGEDDGSNAAGNDDPPLDENVVHSPVPTQGGGKPKTKEG